MTKPSRHGSKKTGPLLALLAARGCRSRRAAITFSMPLALCPSTAPILKNLAALVHAVVVAGHHKLFMMQLSYSM